MISMSSTTEAFLPTDTNEVVYPSLIMYLKMALHICLLGERVPTIRKCASKRSFRSVRPYMIHKFTERFPKYIAILSFLALINILKTICFHFCIKLEN